MITILNEWVTYMNVIAIGTIVILTIIGYIRGIFRSVIALLETVVSLYAGYLLAPILAHRIDLIPASWLEKMPLLNLEAIYTAMNMIGWFIVTTAVVRILFFILDLILRFMDHLPFIEATSKPLGALFGFAEGALLVFLCMCALHSPFVSNGSEVISQSVLAPFNGIAQDTEQMLSEKLIKEHLIEDLTQDFMDLTEEQRKFIENLLDECGLDANADIYSLIHEMRGKATSKLESLLNDSHLPQPDFDAIKDFLLKDEGK